MRDRVNLVYTNTPFNLEEHFSLISCYADDLRDAAAAALEEEAILIVVFKVYHAESGYFGRVDPRVVG
jgi:hypothetical protein